MSTSSHRTKAAQREHMLRTLLQTGRAMFAEHGYAQVSTEALVQQAGVTRGALYHYFTSKEALFHAVLEDVQRSVAAQIVDYTSEMHDPWEQLRVGCQVFLKASLDRDVQQIMLIDGPAVVGWQEWRRMDAAHAMQLLRDVISQLMADGVLKPQPIDALVHMLSGAMNEAALWIAQAPDAERALAEALAVFDTLLAALRCKGPASQMSA